MFSHFKRFVYCYAKIANLAIITAVIVIAFFGLNLNKEANAASVLSAGDIYIISVNSDNAYISGSTTANSNGFSFVSRVDLDAGAQIWFTDKGWDGSLATPFWRNTAGEGALRYTVPAGGISAGTIVRYDDTMIPTIPSSGSSTWDMYNINGATGAINLSVSAGNTFDPATAGDNILIFQGSPASPNFLFGIGWSAATTWISSGTPTANNSWIPSSLSAAGGTIVNLGSPDNYQYKCSSPGIFSTDFASNLQSATNWNSNDATAYGSMPGSCVFDASRPTPTITQTAGQNDPTNVSSISFTITFDQAIDPASFINSDITISGTGSATISSLTTTDNITWTLNLTATSEGTVVVTLPAARVTDPNLNPNLASVNTDNSVLYDITNPATLAATDLASSSDSGVSDSDNITNDTTPTFTGSCTDGDTIELVISGSPVTPTAICASGTYSITLDNALAEADYSIYVTATDPAKNKSADSASLNFTVDTTGPACSLSSQNTFETSPAIEGTIDDAGAEITITVEGNTYPVTNNGGTWQLASGIISPALNIGQTYAVNIDCMDVAGNQTYTSGQTLLVQRHIDLAVNTQLMTTGVINAGSSAEYQITLTNLDPTYTADIANTFFYILVPDVLVASAGSGQVLPTDNPNMECFNYSPTGDLDELWHQYPNHYVIVCGALSGTNVGPGQTVKFNLPFTAESDLPDGTTLSTLIFDESDIEIDSSIIDDAANSGNDFYALSLNNISKAIYRIPVTNGGTTTPTTTITTGTSAAVSQKLSQLASTGQNQSTYLAAATLATIVGLAALAKKHRLKL